MIVYFLIILAFFLGENRGARIRSTGRGGSSFICFTFGGTTPVSCTESMTGCVRLDSESFCNTPDSREEYDRYLSNGVV